MFSLKTYFGSLNRYYFIIDTFLIISIMAGVGPFFEHIGTERPSTGGVRYGQSQGLIDMNEIKKSTILLIWH